jgi:hypothetical protein
MTMNTTRIAELESQNRALVATLREISHKASVWSQPGRSTMTRNEMLDEFGEIARAALATAEAA